MDYITSKVFVIAVGIFVTLSIVTMAILSFTKLGEIFNFVENTDISIRNQYDNMYSMYNGAELNTVGLLNALRRYEEDDAVKIRVVNNSYIVNIDDDDEDTINNKTDMIKDIESKIRDGILDYHTPYVVSVTEDSMTVNLTFTKK
ncbi:MAG: hypothetical protein IKV94_04505 [Clostridia bacterium]|nr:hypothetical protein [Clostridia bacterium]